MNACVCTCHNYPSTAKWGQCVECFAHPEHIASRIAAQPVAYLRPNILTTNPLIDIPREMFDGETANSNRPIAAIAGWCFVFWLVALGVGLLIGATP